MSRRRTVAEVGAFVVVLGLPDGLLGVIWPALHRSMHRPLADLGELVVATTVAGLVGAIGTDRLSRVIGPDRTLVAAVVLAAVALVLFWIAPAWWWVVVALGLLGLSKGVTDAVLNAVAALEGGIRRLGLLHASWAVGATLAPLLVAVLVAGDRWRPAVAVVAGAAVILVPISVVPAAAPAGREDSPPPEPPPANWRWGLAATGLAFLAYAAAESGFVAWAATYLTADRHLATDAAAGAMALFWAPLALGRLAVRGSDRLPQGRLLEGSFGLLVVGALAFALLPGAWCVAGLPLAGAGSAPIFPLYMALSPSRLGEAATGRAAGLAVGGAAVGGAAAAAAYGLVAGAAGAGVLAPCFVVAAVAAYGAHRVLLAVTSP